MMGESSEPRRPAFGTWVTALLVILILPAIAAGQGAIASARSASTPTFQELQTLAQQAFARKDVRRAIQLYREALRIQPKWADGWRNVGILLAQVKDYPPAITAFGNFIQLQPKDGSGWVLRGLCEFELHRYSQALDDLQQGAHLGLHNAALEKVATYHASLIYLQKGNFYVATRLLTHLAREGVHSSDLIAAFGLATLRIARLPGEWASNEQKALVLAVGQIALNAVSAPPAKIIPDYEALIQKFPRTRGLHYALGNYLMYQGQYGSALAQMKAELQLDPSDPMALLQAAMSELQLGHPHQALPYAQKASAIAPTLFAVHYTLGLTLYQLNEIPQALKELKMAVKLAPNSPQAHYALSHAYLKAGDQPAALREGAIFAKLKQEPTAATTFRFRNQKPVPSAPITATALDSQALKATFTQAEQDLRESRYVQAEAGFRQVLKLQPNYPPAYCDLGVVCLRTNRINHAIHYFQTAQKLAPKLAGIHLDLGLAYYQKRDFPKALPEFAAVLQSDPHNLQARYLEGLCYFVMNNYAKTVEALEPLWNQEKSALDYLFVLGISYGKLKENQKSERVFEKLVKIGGNSPHFHLLMGRAYEGLYWNQRAYKELKEAVAGDPKLPYAHYSLGMVEMRLGKLRQAGRDFDAEIALNPKSPWSYQKRGIVDLDLNNPSHAILMFKDALARNSQLPQSLNGIGKAYFMEGKYQQAVAYYLKALALLPHVAHYHYELGQAYMHLGNRVGAQHEFAEAQKLQAATLQRQQKQLSAPGSAVSR